MQATVFLAGSRSIKTLHPEVKARLQQILDQNLKIVMADNSGADKAFQQYLADKDYREVYLTSTRWNPRNNIGRWSSTMVGGRNMRIKELNAFRDQSLGQNADYAFILWNGTSEGTRGTIEEMVRQKKKTLVYFQKEKRFELITEDNPLPEPQS